MSKSINAFICPLLLKGLRQLQQFHLKKENNGDSCFIVWFHHLVESVSCSDPSLYFYYSCTGECKSGGKKSFSQDLLCSGIEIATTIGSKMKRVINCEIVISTEFSLCKVLRRMFCSQDFLFATLVFQQKHLHVSSLVSCRLHHADPPLFLQSN